MSLQSLLLLNQVLTSAVILVREHTLALDISPGHEEDLLLLFKTKLRLSHLHGAVTISGLLELNILPQVEVLLSYSIVVSFQSRVLRSDF
jgi:hypothetical protein